MSANNGSELHRLKDMEEYNPELFNKLYKRLKPLVRNLARNIDHRRFNVSGDIIESYFWDKFIYVFNKYQKEYDEDRLQATLINSLRVFKNRLLRKAYNEQAEYNQKLTSLEGLFDNSKEWVDNDIEALEEQNRLDSIHEYMKNNMSPDGYLLFTVQIDPPGFIRSKLKTQNSKISTIMLLDYFELPRTKTNARYISELRKEIDYYIEKAKTELK